MALTPKLALRQTTGLVMTPQLQQAIKLLQLSNQELAAVIDVEVQENPLLERESAEGGMENESDSATTAPEADSATPESDGESDGEPDGEPEVADTAELSTAEHLPEEADAPLDTEYTDVWSEAEGTGADTPAAQFDQWGAGGSFEGPGLDLEERLPGQISLRDHLTGQMNIEFTDPAKRMIGAALIDMLDDAGYLTGDLDEVAVRLGINVAEVESVLTTLQNLDPCGVFARNLGECLALQLRDLDRLDPAMSALVANLDLLAKRNVEALKRICGIDDEDLAQMITEIRALDPKPGLKLESDVTHIVVPDILVRATSGAGWHVELNADSLPRVLVNQNYFATIKKAARTKEEKSYLSERMSSANWLVRALHQRATTILKVATEIVRTQERFFNHGIQYLKPLTLHQVADAIGMHESTVSRVTSNKFMATPRGLFELKYFFTAAIGSSAGGDAHSAESVRCRVRELIDEEAPKAVLSDDKIVKILSDEGVDIARRTVAKYRESMRIPSSVQRRREKAMTL